MAHQPTTINEAINPFAVATLRIELLDVKPLVWREIQVPVSIELPTLHTVLQIAIGWEDRHLYEFSVGGDHYSYLDPDYSNEFPHLKDATGVKLLDLLKQSPQIIYTYDFGDDWRHEITLLTTELPRTPSKKVQLLNGEGLCPPEDCGGPAGLDYVREVVYEPEHEDYNEYRAAFSSHFEGDFKLNQFRDALTDADI